MLQRLNFSLDEELLCGDGVWPRDRLLAMDASYTAAVERAFELGLESRAAAAATVSFRNGKAAALEGALEGAWNSLISKRGRWRLRKSWRMCALDALESKFFVSDSVFNSGFVSVGRGGSVCT